VKEEKKEGGGGIIQDMERGSEEENVKERRG
jgi:hypothetical protein